MTRKETEDLIKKHEGFSLKIYEDTLGFPTVGYGHSLRLGSKISKKVANMLFREDMDAAELNRAQFCNYYELTHLSFTRKAVLANMFFNMGGGVYDFKKMIKALQEKDYATAAMEMLDSKWAKQVKGRAYDLARIMETGKYEDTNLR